ncbi:hypothetical protein [Streptomyces sp. NPDC002851]
MRFRFAAGAAAAASLLVLFGAPAAMADDDPLVKSDVNTGVSVGGLLDVGASSEANGTAADSNVKVDGPAGVSTSIDSDTSVGVDVLSDLLASVSLGLD